MSISAQPVLHATTANNRSPISNGTLVVGRLLRLTQACSPGLIDDGIRLLIRISQAVFLLDGFVVALAAWHETSAVSSRLFELTDPELKLRYSSLARLNAHIWLHYSSLGNSQTPSGADERFVGNISADTSFVPLNCCGLKPIPSVSRDSRNLVRSACFTPLAVGALSLFVSEK
jgi:hypothetical protein